MQSLTSQTSGGAGVAEGDGSAPAPLTEEQRDAALELREKLRIVQTVLEQVRRGMRGEWFREGYIWMSGNEGYLLGTVCSTRHSP